MEEILLFHQGKVSICCLALAIPSFVIVFAAAAQNITAMETCVTQDEQECYEELDDVAIREEIENLPGRSDINAVDACNEQMCPPGMHSWHDDMCMVCTVCQECTGYSVSCLSSMRADRNPGQ